MNLEWPSKDPDATLDYDIDWSAWLGQDTIAGSVWTVPAGLTSVLEENTTTKASIWLTGGTAARNYTITNTITTAGGRVQSRSVRLPCRER